MAIVKLWRYGLYHAEESNFRRIIQSIGTYVAEDGQYQRRRDCNVDTARPNFSDPRRMHQGASVTSTDASNRQ